MNRLTTNLTRIALLLAVIVPAGVIATQARAEHTASNKQAAIWAAPQPAAAALQATDPRIIEVLPIQTITGEPLVIGKSTVVRVRVGATASRSKPLTVTVELNFDGKDSTQDVPLTRNDTMVDFFVDPPAGEPHDIAIQATLSTDVDDPDPQNNIVQLSWPTVLMPKTQLKVFYLPVDWTEEMKEECEFDTYFAEFVQEDTDFARATYPLPDDQVVSDSTTVPHMLAPDERDVVNSDLVYNSANTMNLFASVILAGKTYAPDAELIAAVMPPRWIQDHANPRAAGFASAGVRGATIVLLGGTNGAGTVIAHEFGHIRQLTDDYNGNFSGYPIDQRGYWVTRKMPIGAGKSTSPFSFMGASGTAGVDAWIDSRTYEHLLAKYVSEGGQASRPLVLAATLAPAIDENGAPTYASAGSRIYAPDSRIVLTVAHVGLEPGTTLHVRWLRSGQVVAEQDQTVDSNDFGYTPFTLNSTIDAGLPLGPYSFEVSSGDEVVKEGTFLVADNWLPAMSIALGDNKNDLSAGYRGGLGVSLVSSKQPSVFVPSVASDSAAIYGWFVAQSDGNSGPRDYDVEMRFFDPDGKQYAGEWVDDGSVTADSRVTDASIARKRLVLAGTDAATKLGTWKLVAYIDGKQVGSTTFDVAARGAASNFDRLRDAARAAGLDFVDGDNYPADVVGLDGGLAVLSYRPAEPNDPYTADSLKEVWAGFNALRSEFPDAGTLMLQIAWSERYSLVYVMKADVWDKIATRNPSLNTLGNSGGFGRLVQDLMGHTFLSGDEAGEFYQEHFGR